MHTHDEIIDFHKENQEIINTATFDTRQELNQFVLHSFSYLVASRLAKNKSVLDLGCNVGYGSQIISKNAKLVEGVDVSEKSIERAKQKYHSNNVNFQKIDGKKLPFKDYEFDLIVSCQVIEHIVGYQEYLGEIKRVLKSDGLVIFTTPNAVIRLEPGMKPWYEFHVREFNARELKKLLKENFFDVGVYGLFAEDPIYSTEFQRVTSILNYVRAQGKPPGLKQRVKVFIPEPLLKLILAARNYATGKRKGVTTSDLSQSFIESMLTCQLYYSTEKIDSSLDLLAICSNRDGIIDDADSLISGNKALGKDVLGDFQ